MAFSMGNNGGRGRHRSSIGAVSEINVVPLVDVVLVLLIIFMLTAQVMEFGLQIEVPKVKPNATSAKELPVISVTKNGEVYLNESKLSIYDAKNVADEVKKKFGDVKEVYVRADKGLTWENLAQTISAVSAARLTVRLVTKSEDIADKGR